MIHKIIQYTTEAKHIDLITAAIAELLDGIRRNEPATYYNAYRIRGTNSFLHFMVFHDEHAEQVHRNASYTKQFTDIVYPLCTGKPVITELEKVEGVIGGEYE